MLSNATLACLTLQHLLQHGTAGRIDGVRLQHRHRRRGCLGRALGPHGRLERDLRRRRLRLVTVLGLEQGLLGRRDSLSLSLPQFVCVVCWLVVWRRVVCVHVTLILSRSHLDRQSLERDRDRDRISRVAGQYDIARCDVTSGATSRQVDFTSVIGGESGSHTPATSLLVTMTSYPLEFCEVQLRAAHITEIYPPSPPARCELLRGATR